MIFIKLHDASKGGLEIFINPSKVVCIQKVDVGRNKGKTRIGLDSYYGSIADVNEPPEEIIDLLNRVND